VFIIVFSGIFEFPWFFLDCCFSGSSGVFEFPWLLLRFFLVFSVCFAGFSGCSMVFPVVLDCA